MRVFYLSGVYLFPLLLLGVSGARSQSGILDSSFASNGIYKYEVAGFHSTNSTGIEAQDDGTYVICGKAASHDPDISNFLAIKLNHDGSMDSSFGTYGYSMHGLYYRAFSHDLGIDADGKILLTGQDFNSTANLENIGIMRLNSDGSPDLSFGDSGRVALDYGSHEEGHAILQQPDGKVLIAGHSNYDAPSGTIESTMMNFFVARLQANGQLDTSFAYNGFFTLDVNDSSSDFCKDMILKSNGKILCCGTSSNLTYRYATLVQLKKDGTLDSSFGTNGIVKQLIGTEAVFWHLVLQQDGRIITVGQAIFNNADYDLMAARYNKDGSIDSSFGNDGWLSYDMGGDDEKFEGAVIQSDGKIVCAGYTHNGAVGNPVVYRFNQDGSLDTSFANDGLFILTSLAQFDETKGCALDNNGDILVTGILHDIVGSGSEAFVFRLKGGCSANYSITAAGPTTFCQGGTVKLTVSPPASSYQWTKNGSDITGATSISYIVKTAGNYACSISGDCGVTTTSSINVEVIVKPKAIIKPTGIVNMCDGDSVLLAAKNILGQTYQWFRNNVSIIGATNASYMAKEGGQYYFITSNTSGCTRQSSKTKVQVTCKSGEVKSDDFVLYPNPSSGIIYVHSNEPSGEYIAWEVYDGSGKLLLSGNESSASGDFQLDLSLLRNGIYFIKTKTGLDIHRKMISIIKD